MRLLVGAGLIAVWNALAPRIAWSLDKGLWVSLSETVGVSAIVWLALAVLFAIVLSESEPPANAPTGFDWALAAAVVAASLLPAPLLAAAALFPLAVHALLTAGANRALRRCAAILLALTLTLLWGPLALRFVPELLAADAQLVAWALGGDASGNLFTSLDGDSRFLVAPGCSSLNNISLATILAVTLAQYFDVPLRRGVGVAIVIASALTVIINVARLGVIARNPGDFVYWHHGAGAAMFGWAVSAAILVVVSVAIDRAVPRAPA